MSTGGDCSHRVGRQRSRRGHLVAGIEGLSASLTIRQSGQNLILRRVSLARSETNLRHARDVRELFGSVFEKNDRVLDTKTTLGETEFVNNVLTCEESIAGTIGAGHHDHSDCCVGDHLLNHLESGTTGSIVRFECLDFEPCCRDVIPDGLPLSVASMTNEDIKRHWRARLGLGFGKLPDKRDYFRSQRDDRIVVRIDNDRSGVGIPDTYGDGSRIRPYAGSPLDRQGDSSVVLQPGEHLALDGLSVGVVGTDRTVPLSALPVGHRELTPCPSPSARRIALDILQGIVVVPAFAPGQQLSRDALQDLRRLPSGVRYNDGLQPRHKRRINNETWDIDRRTCHFRELIREGSPPLQRPATSQAILTAPHSGQRHTGPARCLRPPLHAGMRRSSARPGRRPSGPG